ncbi:Geranylgeranyl reductase flavoprotein [Methanonatronarchaeum thermophilum]|uniref:Geranylgeranyl reductase flavoprotein n=1 Tax=Methanonatronarchaeum thermophilum TaxID=1927129 RepID=A0A1Y3G9F3_9EURY|nr:NAD(P)/FAD-dependent oxidoreductase [Methanonatronarchaeum thermophilum]OUJ18039.1 Geranylgeranyl reductase flavoprotein [Methanonatronarchaeum thermophilum]
MISSVVVAGGGLSGLLAARYINKLVPTVDVRVFERRSRGNYRVDCGEGFIDFRGVLSRVISEVRPFIRSEVSESVWRFQYDGGTRNVRIEHDDFFWIIDRLGWQKKILKDIEGEVDVVFGEEVEIDDFSCDLVVDARGPSYKVGSAVYGVYEGSFDSVLGKAVFDYRERLDGYYWIFPMEEGRANIGYGGFGEDIGKKRLDSYVESLPLNIDSKKKSGGGYLDYTYYLKDVHGKKTGLIDRRDGGWIARVGDAAGIVNPLIGEGISGAVSTSYQLARAIKQNDLDKYPVWVKKENKHSISLSMARLRKKKYSRFVERFSKLDGVKASHCYSVPKFMFRHPIRSIKFLIA